MCTQERNYESEARTGPWPPGLHWVSFHQNSFKPGSRQPPEQFACAQVCGSLGASTHKALPVVELEAWTPVGCAQQGLYSTGQIDEHVAHEEEPEAEGREAADHPRWHSSTLPLFQHILLTTF